MTEPTPRFWEVFFEVYEPLPRQGPGNRACAARALGLCRDLKLSPTVLDLGCGVGGQTLQLAELTSGSIVAIDLRAYFDNVRHHVLLTKVARRINDDEIMRLLKLVLKANGDRWSMRVTPTIS